MAGKQSAGRRGERDEAQESTSEAELEQTIEVFLKENFKQLDMQLDPPYVTENALHLAAVAGRADVVEALLRTERFSDVSINELSYGGTSLHLAAEHGHASVARALLASSRFTAANAYKKRCGGYDGHTALHVAAVAGHVAVVRELLASERFALQDARTLLMKDTALHVAAQKSRPEHVEVVQALLDSSRFTALDARDVNCQTALHRAARLGKTEVAEALLLSPRFHGASFRAGGYPGFFGSGPCEALGWMFGQTATDVAEASGYQETAAAIQKLQSNRTGFPRRVLSWIGHTVLLAGHLGWLLVHKLRHRNDPPPRCGTCDVMAAARERQRAQNIAT